MKAIDYDWGVEPASSGDEAISIMLGLLEDGVLRTLYEIDQRWIAAGHEELSGCALAGVLHRIALDGHPLYVEEIGEFEEGYRLTGGRA